MALPDCYSCRQTADPQAPERERVARTDHWRVAHAFDSALAGWLIVVPARHVTAFSELTARESAELGELLRTLSVALERATGCVKTYLMLFAEAPGYEHLHVHVVPRSADLPVDRMGPLVFGYLGVPEGERVPDAEVDRLVQRIRAELGAPPPSPDSPAVTVRRARTGDVPAMIALVSDYAQGRILLGKERVTLYEDVQEFQVAVGPDGEVIGCGALHVLWEDLGEIRTLAVSPAWRGRAVGHRILEALITQAREVGVGRLFCLTFEVEFFARHGFRVIDGTPVQPAVYAELLRSMDEGVAEFLDLARVKPNTLGNTRMLRHL